MRDCQFLHCFVVVVFYSIFMLKITFSGRAPQQACCSVNESMQSASLQPSALPILTQALLRGKSPVRRLTHPPTHPKPTTGTAVCTWVGGGREVLL